ncbi:MAG: acyl-CoA reductase [Flavobacteriaceae bacterium]|nr:acyl-CoA reductase [Flavobacteriaceae bacterium]
MDLLNRKNAFIQLGNFFQTYLALQENEIYTSSNPQLIKFHELLLSAKHYNAWFTLDQLKYALTSWSEVLTDAHFDQWLANYQLTSVQPKKVGIVMAGNIPLVGFHDFICVSLVGHYLKIKPSSNDFQLLPFIIDFLAERDDYFKNYIEIKKERLEDFDAVIATGSNNTARYFEYYFRDYPNIIRKNRNSVAVIEGDETEEELEKLGEDMFRYFGLGCRSVSKLYVPQAYDFKPFFEAIYNYSSLLNHHKYVNNYDYNKAVYLMSQVQLLDNNFVILKEDESLSSPIGCIFYERYIDKKKLSEKLASQSDDIQCVVSKNQSVFKEVVDFGKTQQPNLWDYADNIDTLAFLLKI